MSDHTNALDIAVTQLHDLYHELKELDGGTTEQRLQLGMLAAHVEIAERLGGIANSLDRQS